ncbi:MAG: histidine phosphatase family protein [Patescibacteria group bacterium]
MADLTTIYVVRHGQSFFNATENIESIKHDGEFGSPLTPEGKAQSKALAYKLKDINFAAILSSDLNRTIETAEIIAAQDNLKVETNNTIRERSIFDYLNSRDGLKRDGLDNLNSEIHRDLAKLDEKEKMNYKHTSNMESAEEGALRLFKFILGAEAKYHGKTILIVSHGNIMRSLLTYLGWVKYNELPSGSIKNTGYFILQVDGDSFKVTQTSGINRQTGKFRTF